MASDIADDDEAICRKVTHLENARKHVMACVLKVLENPDGVNIAPRTKSIVANIQVGEESRT